MIVDESHHARSELSIEMLANFNPCFVLDLTATPKKRSNIISYVDAVQLKAEHMVKLPVIVYNRDSQAEVLMDTCLLYTSFHIFLHLLKQCRIYKVFRTLAFWRLRHFYANYALTCIGLYQHTLLS